MLRLADLGPDGFRRELEREQSREREQAGLQGGIASDATAGRVNRGSAGAVGRKASASQRLLIDAQLHRQLVLGRIHNAYTDPEIRKEIAAHATTTTNLLRRVTDRVAVLYDRPPTRRVRGATDEEIEELLAHYEDAETNIHAELWNRYAFYLSVCHVIPRYEDNELVWVTVTPDVADVVWDPAGEREPSIFTYETDVVIDGTAAVRIAVDTERWWWLSSEGQVLRDEKHGIGVRPWVAFRVSAPVRGDYWQAGAGEDMRDGTLEVARIDAQMRWTRKNNATKLLTIATGTEVHTPANQNIRNGQPVRFTGDGQVKLEVLDTIVSIDEFVKEKADVIESVSEAYGLPANLVDASTASTDDARNVFQPAQANAHEALAKLRARHQKHFERAEQRLAYRAARLLSKHGRLKLDPGRVRTGFRTTYVAPTFVDHPRALAQTAVEEMKLGLTNPYLEYQRRNPNTSFREAVEEVNNNVKLRTDFYREFVQHSMDLDPTHDLDTDPQATGRVGGQAKPQPPTQDDAS